MQGRYRSLVALAALLLLPYGAAAEEDVAAARALFEKNLQSIRDKDRDAYRPATSSPTGWCAPARTASSSDTPGLAATAGEGWPDHIAADDLRLTPVRPGLVYGTYRYRVRYGKEEVSGLSERLFVETPEGWRTRSAPPSPRFPACRRPPRPGRGPRLWTAPAPLPVPDAIVVLRDGKIDCAGPRSACPLPEGIDTVDLRGHWITPGLVDAHVHFSQTGWADGRPGTIDVGDRHPYEEVVADLRAHPERFGRSLLCSGVTSGLRRGRLPLDPLPPPSASSPPPTCRGWPRPDPALHRGITG